MGQAGYVKVSGVVKSASGSSQGLVPLLCQSPPSVLMPASALLLPFSLTACGVGVQKLSFVWCESPGELVPSDPVHGLVCQL